MAETQPSSFADTIRKARERLEQELRAQAERLEKLHTELTQLRQLHEHTEQEAARQWEEAARAGELALAKAAELAEAKAAELSAKTAELAAAQEALAQVSPEKVLEDVLDVLQGLMTCTIPEQVLEVLTQEAAQWGVRAAIFDVRGKAAWGASAHGFGPALSEKDWRAVIVPLNQDNPFRQVCESAGHVEASDATLKKNRNVLDKLRPASGAPILLIPIRSGGTVTAILYADPGEKTGPLPVHALQVFAEFAGAQIDRLIALSGGIPSEAAVPALTEAEEPEAPAEELPVQEAAPAETHATEPAVAPQVVGATPEAQAEAAVVETPVSEPRAPAPPAEVAAEGPAAVAPPAVEPPAEAAPLPAFDVSQLSEAEQKVHKDARRFAKLLVSEIELYNKIKVADGRKNHDLYNRLKSDIDRSRQTFEKRFSKVLLKQVDYFHEELVKTLAVNDSSALGPEYPGPSA